MTNAQEAAAEFQGGEPPAKQSRSLWWDAWRRMKRNKLAIVSLVYLILITLACVFAPLSPYNPADINLDQEVIHKPPSAKHWFGTDLLGRDLFTRVLYGGRISLLVGVCATAVSLLIGVSYGMIAGYVGGKTDRLMMRAVEIVYSLPFIIFVILLMVTFGRNIILIFVAIGAVEWLTMARIIRGQTLALREHEFIKASLVVGQPNTKVIFKHILPNVMGTILVYATLTVPGVMLLESFISFLGLGVQAPNTSWGTLIKEGADAMEQYPWLLIFPSVAFSLTLFSLNFLGDGLRDALDPRSGGR